jgi:adenylylsulfate kinase-like enzyme
MSRNTINVVITGCSGSGKTTIALVLIRALREHGVSVEFVDEDPQSVDVLDRIDKNLKEMKRKGREVHIKAMTTMPPGIARGE